mmetsp:Transcript_2694/g.3684  ORF Transcript_2694/g.3684 Transcript_2694/m.3684 type:complete len:136 (-) Transcript_2694:55-462(-)
MVMTKVTPNREIIDFLSHLMVKLLLGASSSLSELRPMIGTRVPDNLPGYKDITDTDGTTGELPGARSLSTLGRQILETTTFSLKECPLLPPSPVLPQLLRLGSSCRTLLEDAANDDDGDSTRRLLELRSHKSRCV